MPLEREVRRGRWVRVTGPLGTEHVDAGLVGEVQEVKSKVLVPIPESLGKYCLNQEVWSVYCLGGWGARLVCTQTKRKTVWHVLPSPDSVDRFFAILEPVYEGGMVELFDLP